MKIENLEVGLRIKNYKELCNILDIPTTTGEAKQNQLEEISRYCKFHKEGNKFIIDEIYKEPLPKKLDNRINNQGGNNMKYCDDIETLILYILAQAGDDEYVNLSTNQLLLAVNMINKNYQVGRTRIPKLSEILEIPTAMIYDFYDTTSVELKRKLETNLNRLQRQCLIFWHKSIKIQTTNVEIEYNAVGQPVLNSKGFVVQHKNREHREASEIEIKMLLRIEREVLMDMGYKNKQKLFLYGNFNTFKTLVQQKIKFYNLNIDYYYHSYKIIYNNEHIKQAILDIEKLEASENINKNIVDCFKKSYEHKYKVANKKVTTKQLGFEFGIKNDIDLANAQKIVNNENYLKNNNKLIGTLIDCRSVDYTLTLVEPMKKVSEISEDFINEDFSYKYKDLDNQDIPF